MRRGRVELRRGGMRAAMSRPKIIRAVEVRAEVRQLKTMADGSVNLTLNLPEDCKEQTKVLLDWLGLEIKAILQSDKR